jgi:two-component system CheB/CheR fusion protein
LRANEVQGKNFLTLDIGLPVEQLKQPIRAGLAKEYEFLGVSLAAINRHGKSIQCKIICCPLVNSGVDVHGVILLVEEC